MKLETNTMCSVISKSGWLYEKLQHDFWIHSFNEQVYPSLLEGTKSFIVSVTLQKMHMKRGLYLVSLHYVKD